MGVSSPSYFINHMKNQLLAICLCIIAFNSNKLFAQEKEFAVKVINKSELFLSLDGILDKEKQMEIVNKEIKNLEKYLESLDKKLSNQTFLDKASPDIVNSEKQKYNDSKEKLSKLLNQVKN